MRKRGTVLLALFLLSIPFAVASGSLNVPVIGDLENSTESRAAAAGVPVIACFEGVSEQQAAQSAALLYYNGLWKTADMQTVGCYIMERRQEDHVLTLSVYTAHQVYDTSSGEAVVLAGAYVPVRMKFDTSRSNTYALLSCETPGDGTHFWKDVARLFSGQVAAALGSKQEDYKQYAMNDADETARLYIETGGAGDGVWDVFLETGSNPDAYALVCGALPNGYYPCYCGMYIQQYYGNPYTRYILTVDGEQSYSGILHYSSYDEEGNQLTHFVIQAQDDQLVILEGEIPPVSYD